MSKRTSTGVRVIEAWVCDECGYWRKEKATGVHQTSNPENWRGAMVTHPLRFALFVEIEKVDEAPVAPRGKDAIGG